MSVDEYRRTITDVFIGEFDAGRAFTLAMVERQPNAETHEIQ